VQVCSTLYKNGVGHIEKMLGEVTDWMDGHGYSELDGFRGKLSQDESGDPAAYERVQFMKGTGGVS
jgi:dihydroorotate dehydrogenase (fumarate)